MANVNLAIDNKVNITAESSLKQSRQLSKPSRTLWGDALHRFRRHKLAMTALTVLVIFVLTSIFGPILYPVDPEALDFAAVFAHPMSPDHILGTDGLGRDMLARVLFGGRISLSVGFVAMAIAVILGSVIGSVAGYFGGKIDSLLMRIVDVLYTFPFLIFVILLMVFFADQKSPLYSAFKVVISPFVESSKDQSHYPIFQLVIVFAAIGAISWLTMSRIVRGQVLSLKSQPFVEAARSIGVGPGGLIFRHLVPIVKFLAGVSG